MTMKRYTAILMLFAAAACQHKDLCYDHPHQSGLEVNIDWTKAPDADVETMELFLFPAEGGKAIHHTFQNRDGGRLTVPQGTYRAICTSTGRGANRFSGLETSFEEFAVSTRTVGDAEAYYALKSELSDNVPKADQAEAENTIVEPDMLYSGRLGGGIEVRDRQVGKITFYPEQKTPRYTIIVKNISNLQNTKDCMASISSLSNGFFLGADSPESGKAIQAIQMSRTDDSTVQGDMTFFGHCNETLARHYISLYFILLDGTGVYYSSDITEKFNDPAIKGRMKATIVLDLGIEIPKPITNGSGFQPTLDGWRNESIEVSM